MGSHIHMDSQLLSVAHCCLHWQSTLLHFHVRHLPSVATSNFWNSTLLLYWHLTKVKLSQIIPHLQAACLLLCSSNLLSAGKSALSEVSWNKVPFLCTVLSHYEKHLKTVKTAKNTGCKEKTWEEELSSFPLVEDLFLTLLLWMLPGRKK